MEKSHIVVACSSDDKYAPYCGAMITSLLHNNMQNDIKVYILSANMSRANLAKFTQLAKEYNQQITIVTIDAEKFLRLPIGRRFTNITKETYFRLALPSLFPYENKILYLDCDMIVRHDLRELWKTDLDGYAIASVKDNVYMIQQNIVRLGYPIEHSYYNIGMGLYNLAFLREFNFETKVWNYIDENLEKIVYHDQDIINAVCHGLFKDVSVRWNMLDVFLMVDPHIVDEKRTDLENWIENPGIIHFSAKYKPWNTEGFHPYGVEFWKYVKISPWADIKPKPRFKGYEEIKVKTKLQIKELLSMLGCQKYQYRTLRLRD